MADPFLMSELDRLRAEVDFWKTENESRAHLLKQLFDIIGYNNDDGFHCDPGPLEIAQALVAKANELNNMHKIDT